MEDNEFMVKIIEDICNYAVANGMEPDDVLSTVASNVLSLLGSNTFNNWKLGGE